MTLQTFAGPTVHPRRIGWADARNGGRIGSRSSDGAVFQVVRAGSAGAHGGGWFARRLDVAGRVSLGWFPSRSDAMLACEEDMS